MSVFGPGFLRRFCGTAGRTPGEVATVELDGFSKLQRYGDILCVERIGLALPLGSSRPFAAVRLDVDTLEQVLKLSPLGLGFRRGVGCWCVGLVPQPVGELLDVIGIPPKGF